jgi:hypothetical protein
MERISHMPMALQEKSMITLIRYDADWSNKF